MTDADLLIGISAAPPCRIGSSHSIFLCPDLVIKLRCCDLVVWLIKCFGSGGSSCITTKPVLCSAVTIRRSGTVRPEVCRRQCRDIPLRPLRHINKCLFVSQSIIAVRTDLATGSTQLCSGKMPCIMLGQDFVVGGAIFRMTTKAPERRLQKLFGDT